MDFFRLLACTALLSRFIGVKLALKYKFLTANKTVLLATHENDANC